MMAPESDLGLDLGPPMFCIHYTYDELSIVRTFGLSSCSFQLLILYSFFLMLSYINLATFDTPVSLTFTSLLVSAMRRPDSKGDCIPAITEWVSLTG